MASGGGLKTGDVYVAIGASLGELTKGLTAAIKQTEQAAAKLGKSLQAISDGVSAVSTRLLAMSALAVGAVAIAAQSSKQAQEAVDSLALAFTVLSSEIGELFVPVVRQTTELVKVAIATWRGLDAGLKAQLVTVVKTAALWGLAGKGLAQALAVGKGLTDVVGKVAGAFRVLLGPLTAVGQGLVAASVSAGKALAAFSRFLTLNVGAAFTSMASSTSSLAASMATLPARVGAVGQSFVGLIPKVLAVGAPLLAVAAAVGAVVLVVGVLYDAWTQTSTGLKAGVEELVEQLKSLASDMRERLASLFSGLTGFLEDGVKLLLDVVAGAVARMAYALAPVAEFLQLDGLAGTLREMQGMTGARLLADLKSGAAAVVDAAREVAESVGESLASVGKDVGKAITTTVQSAGRGLGRLAEDTGLSALLERVQGTFSGLSTKLPALGDAEDVDLSTRVVQVATAVDTAINERFAQSYSAMLGALASGKDPVAEAYKEMQRKLADAARARIQEAQQALMDSWSSALGVITELGNTFRTGMAAGGGDPLLGLAAMAADLLTRSEGFSVVMETVTGLVGLVADSLGQLLEPLGPLVGAVGVLVESALAPLTPAFQLVAELIEPLVPVLVMAGELLGALSPLLSMFVEAIRLLSLPLRLLVEVQLRVLFEALRHAGMAILTVAQAIAPLWNGIVSAVQSVFRKLSEISVFGARPLAFLGGWADSLERGKLSMEQLDGAMAHLRDMTWDAAKEKAAETAEVLRNRKALQQATDALTNVPSAWKRLNLLRFEAQDARGPGGAPQPGGTGGAPAAPGPGAPPPPAAPGVVVENLTVNATDPFLAGEQMVRALDEFAFHSRGTRATPGRYAYEVK